LNVVNCDQVESKPSLMEGSWKNKLQIASYFTPDGDGIADEWRIEGEYSLFVCHIYDRFGKVLKSYENEPIVWDGTYKGAMQPPTDYWYLLLGEGEEERIVGHFTLLK
jgi:gliding motility-associated-like protein